MLEKVEINNTCIACDACRPLCPENAIYTNSSDYVIDPWSCIKCGICISICPNDSIKIKKVKHSDEDYA